MGSGSESAPSLRAEAAKWGAGVHPPGRWGHSLTAGHDRPPGVPGLLRWLSRSRGHPAPGSLPPSGQLHRDTLPLPLPRHFCAPVGGVPVMPRKGAPCGREAWSLGPSPFIPYWVGVIAYVVTPGPGTGPSLSRPTLRQQAGFDVSHARLTGEDGDPGAGAPGLSFWRLRATWKRRDPSPHGHPEEGPTTLRPGQRGLGTVSNTYDNLGQKRLLCSPLLYPVTGLRGRDGRAGVPASVSLAARGRVSAQNTSFLVSGREAQAGAPASLPPRGAGLPHHIS